SLAFYDAASGAIIPAPPPPRPELASLSVRGLQSGATARIGLSGKHLAEVSAVKTSHEKLAARLVAIESGSQVEIEVAPAADLPPGRYELWVTSPGGDSGRPPLFVDDLPQVAESEPNDALAKANTVALGCGVWGVLGDRGDIDSFAFDAKAGTSLVFDVT